MPSVTIDRDDCISCGVCWTSCPEYLEESPEDGYSKVVDEYMTSGDPARGEAPDDLEDCVQDAADGCPVEIIHVS